MYAAIVRAAISSSTSTLLNRDSHSVPVRLCFALNHRVNRCSRVIIRLAPNLR